MTSLMPRSLSALAALCTAILFTPVASATGCPSVVWSDVQRLDGASNFIPLLETIDYDHDGKLDLVGVPDSARTLHTWRGLGDGTFALPVSLGPSMVYDFTVGNVNGDAYPDIVGSTDTKLWVRLGNATGFDPAIETSLNHVADDVSIVDLGNDNVSDLLVSSTSIFVLYQGVGNGTYVEVSRQDTGATDVRTSIFADFDGDGRGDVAAILRSSKTNAVYFRNVDGSFAAPVALSTGSDPTELQATDFNEDGRPDLVSTNWDDGTIDVFLNLGGRSFSSRLVLPGSKLGKHGNLSPLRLADVNGDSHIDILAGAINGGWMVTYLGVGDGTFASGSWYSAFLNGVDAIAAGDFDGDTDIDVALTSYRQLLTATKTCATQVLVHTLSPLVTSGKAAPLRATVSGLSSAMPLPRGTVAFKEGAATYGTVEVGGNGSVSLDLNTLSLGSHNITAEFSGNATLAAATSTSIVQDVTSFATNTIFFFPPEPSVYGTPYSFTVGIRRAENNTSVNAWYLLTIDGVESERYTTSTITLNLTPGPHTLSAKYLGDSFAPASESGPQTITTEKAAATATKSGDTTLRLGATHNVQITIAGPAGTVVPTGSVQLTRGGAVVGNATVTGGIASFSVTLPRGAHDLIATYSGDGNFNATTLSFMLTVVQNLPLVIDARGLPSAMSIRAVVPVDTGAMTLLRRVSGTSAWTVVNGWSLASDLDPSSLARGVVYEYRLDATVSGNPQSSNIDSAMLFHDDTLVAGVTPVERAHFTELRGAINAMRIAAGLEPFFFDPTFAEPFVRAEHVTMMRDAAAEARAAFGLSAMTFTDPSLTAGMPIKAAHVQEIREAVR
jgi:hypothetical protein